MSSIPNPASGADPGSKVRPPALKLAPACTGLLFLGLGVLQIRSEDLWLDELHTWTNLAFGPLFQNVRETEHSHPPLYYAIMEGWTRLAGHGPFALRAPSLLFGMLAFAALAASCKKRMGAAGVAAALLTLTASGLFGQMCGYARNYTIAAWFAVLCHDAFFDWMSSKNNRRAALFRWVAWSTLGLWSNYLFVYVVAMQTLTVLFGSAFSAKTRQAAPSFLAGLGWAAAFFFPCWVLFLKPQMSAFEMMSGSRWNPAHVGAFTAFLPFQVLLSDRIDLYGRVAPLAFLAVPSGILIFVAAVRGLMKKSGERAERAWAASNGVLCLGLLAIPAAASFLGGPYMSGRFFTLAVPSLCVFCGYGIARAWPHRLGKLTAIALFAALFYGRWALIEQPEYGFPSRAAAAALEGLGPNDVVAAAPASVPFIWYYGPWRKDPKALPPLLYSSAIYSMPPGTDDRRADAILEKTRKVAVFQAHAAFLPKGEDLVLRKIREEFLETGRIAFPAPREREGVPPKGLEIDFEALRFEKIRPVSNP